MFANVEMHGSSLVQGKTSMHIKELFLGVPIVETLKPPTMLLLTCVPFLSFVTLIELPFIASIFL